MNTTLIKTEPAVERDAPASHHSPEREADLTPNCAEAEETVAARRHAEETKAKARGEADARKRAAAEAAKFRDD